MSVPGIAEMLVVAGVVVLMFGSKKIPALGGALGESIRNFKMGIKAEEQAPVNVQGIIKAERFTSRGVYLMLDDGIEPRWVHVPQSQYESYIGDTVSLPISQCIEAFECKETGMAYEKMYFATDHEDRWT